MWMDWSILSWIQSYLYIHIIHTYMYMCTCVQVGVPYRVHMVPVGTVFLLVVTVLVVCCGRQQHRFPGDSSSTAKRHLSIKPENVHFWCFSKFHKPFATVSQPHRPPPHNFSPGFWMFHRCHLAGRPISKATIQK
jgi:hypothetical protein